MFRSILMPLAVAAALLNSAHAASDLPPELAPIVLPSLKFDGAGTLASKQRPNGLEMDVAGQLPGGAKKITIPAQAVEAWFSGGNMTVNQLYSAYLKKIQALGGAVVNQGLEKLGAWAPGGEYGPYNNGLMFEIPDGQARRKIVLWLNGDHGYDHAWYVYPKDEAAGPAVISAQAMSDTIKASGKVSLHLNFETAKSDIRPVDQPQLEQVRSLLAKDPALRLRVEGHTDNVGRPQANQTLSAERARSVVAALVASGVSADRLTPAGFGDSHPVASNATAEGRASNRRVELVKQ
jgi:outer membrane protein OmpA-like peptidoglycan-associated protein